jgi:O-antigen/teichoic acid export membrane protein
MSLKQKTVSGLLWSFIDSFANLGIQFIIGIILARLLSPKEFGLIGMLTIFISLSQSFIDSGFRQALIRKKDPSQADYSTVFFFNLIIGVVCFLILFFCAGLISRFFDEPQLKLLVQILGLSLIINAFTIIQQTILTRRIDFKLQTKISIISSIVSGIVGIGMAIAGYGVWSLVIKTITMYVITSILLWLWNRWKPILVFSFQSFKELFSFGSKLLVSGLINTLSYNIYYLVIGKYFSAKELGYYTRADQFNTLPSMNLTSVIQRVSYPVLSSIKDDIPKLKEAYKKLIRSTMLICFVLMLGMAAIARPMILTLIGEKWEPCIIYLQMLCFVGMFYPLHALNLNMLQVEGRSDLFLRLEIIKELLVIPIIVVGVIWGIKAMILGMIINALIAYYLNSYWSGRFIGYSFLEQIKDIFPSFLLAAGMSAVVFVEELLFPLPPLPLLIIQLTTGSLLTIGMCEAFHNKDYAYIKETVKDKFCNIINHDRKNE